MTDIDSATAGIKSTAPLPTRVITYAWGENYLDDLLSVSIPALLAPGNLPFLAARVPCQVVIVTEERLFDRVRNCPIVERLRAICPLTLVGLDDLITAPDKKYGMALTYALHRAFVDLGPAMTDHWMLFLNADFVLADGCLKNLLPHLLNGERLVAAPSYCVVAKEASLELLRHVNPRTGAIAIPPRQMAKIALNYCHNTIRGKTINQNAFHVRSMDQFYWEVDIETLIGHQMPIAIVAMRPERYLEEPNSYWDHGLIREFCPDAKSCVIGDSDEFLMIELRDQAVAQEQFIMGAPEPQDIAERMIAWVTPYQRDYAQYDLVLHSADLPARLGEERRKLRTFLEKVLSYAPEHLPTHLEHAQWNYHWFGFTEARHRYLSQRFGSLAESSPPPPGLLKSDKIWWSFVEKQKNYTRQKKTLTAIMDRQIGLVTKAIRTTMDELETFKDRSTSTFDENFMADLAKSIRDVTPTTPTPTPTPTPTAYATWIQDSHPVTNPNSDVVTDHTTVDPILDIMKRHENNFLKLEEAVRQRNELLRKSLAVIKSHYADRLHAIDEEMARAEAEYRLSPHHRSLPSAAVFLRMRRGSAERNHAIRGRSRMGRLVRRVYYRVFGRWPHVTILSPYWAALRPLHRIVKREAAAGAKDVLFVGDKSEISSRIGTLPGLHAWVTVAGLKTGLTQDGLDLPQFDLCVCDLDFSEILNFPEICQSLIPYMRPGSTVVGFHINSEGVSLPLKGSTIVSYSRSIDATVYYAGGHRLAFLMRWFRLSMAAPPSYRIIYLTKMIIKMALIIPQTLVLNLCDLNKRDHSAIPESGNAASITIEITLP